MEKKLVDNMYFQFVQIRSFHFTLLHSFSHDINKSELLVLCIVRCAPASDESSTASGVDAQVENVCILAH